MLDQYLKQLTKHVIVINNNNNVKFIVYEGVPKRTGIFINDYLIYFSPSKYSPVVLVQTLITLLELHFIVAISETRLL